jgi:hypothetical protein
MAQLRIESLNCHKAAGPTMSFLHHITKTNPNTIILSQEPWLTKRKNHVPQPANMKGYLVWTPTAKPKVVTYIPTKADY